MLLLEFNPGPSEAIVHLHLFLLEVYFYFGRLLLPGFLSSSAVGIFLLDVSILYCGLFLLFPVGSVFESAVHVVIGIFIMNC